MRSLYLDPDSWDICLDGAGRIRVTDGPYACAQNVACACRLFTDDAWYDPDRGVPHFEIELGVRNPALSVFRNRLRKEALRVEGIQNANVEIHEIKDRCIYGDIKLSLTSGDEAEVSF